MWRGTRGEWYAVAQVLLMVLVFLGPRTLAGWPAWPFPAPHACRIAGAILLAAGGLLLAAGLASLGRAITPLPYPREGAPLVQSGPYALVRHPMYGGGLGLGVGWALFVQGWLTFVYVLALFLLLDAKSRREEKWLTDKFPGYEAYARRVRKLVPFIY